jgi:hypothetical protein
LTKISDYDYNRNKNSILSQPINSINLKEDQFMDSNKLYNLPLDNKYQTWGDSIQSIHSSKYRVLNISNNQNLEVITIDKYTKEINVYNSDFTKLIFSFREKILNQDFNIFKRHLNNKIYHIVNNNILFYYNFSLKLKNISKLSKTKMKELNIFTLDVETSLEKDEKMNIYCICTYDGKVSKSYYLTDFIYTQSLINKLFNDLFTK